jgi:hypothetical protein
MSLSKKVTAFGFVFLVAACGASSDDELGADASNVTDGPKTSWAGTFKLDNPSFRGTLVVKSESPFAFDLTVVGKAGSKHVGDIRDGNATLDGRTAVFQGREGPTCKIAFTLAADAKSIDVEQDGECGVDDEGRGVGFGAFVEATGKYVRTSAAPSAPTTSKKNGVGGTCTAEGKPGICYETAGNTRCRENGGTLRTGACDGAKTVQCCVRPGGPGWEDIFAIDYALANPPHHLKIVTINDNLSGFMYAHSPGLGDNDGDVTGVAGIENASSATDSTFNDREGCTAKLERTPPSLTLTVIGAACTEEDKRAAGVYQPRR